MAYHDVRLAPVDRMEDLADINDRYAGSTDLMLFNEFEEFAKYFLRDARINNPTEAITESHIELRDAADFGGRTFDLDLIQLAYVERFPLIVTRRKPTESRPPADYRLDYRNDSYEVWRRVRGPRATDAWPLGDDKRRRQRTRVRADAGVGGHARPRADAGRRAPPRDGDVRLRRRHATGPPRGGRTASGPGLVLLDSPGSASGEVTVAGGRYRVWLEGSFGRPVELRVDGRAIGDAQGDEHPGRMAAGGERDHADARPPSRRGAARFGRPGAGRRRAQLARARWRSSRPASRS